MHLLADLTLKDEFTQNWNSVTIMLMMESLKLGLWKQDKTHGQAQSTSVCCKRRFAEKAA